MSLHPEMAWRLAQAKLEEARSRALLAPALRAASLEREEPADTVARRSVYASEPCGRAQGSPYSPLSPSSSV